MISSQLGPLCSIDMHNDVGNCCVVHWSHVRVCCDDFEMLQPTFMLQRFTYIKIQSLATLLGTHYT